MASQAKTMDLKPGQVPPLPERSQGWNLAIETIATQHTISIVLDKEAKKITDVSCKCGIIFDPNKGVNDQWAEHIREMKHGGQPVEPPKEE